MIRDRLILLLLSAFVVAAVMTLKRCSRSTFATAANGGGSHVFRAHVIQPEATGSAGALLFTSVDSANENPCGDAQRIVVGSSREFLSSARHTAEANQSIGSHVSKGAGAACSRKQSGTMTRKAADRLRNFKSVI